MPGSIKIDDGSGNYTILTNGGSLGSDKTITIPNTTGTMALTSDSFGKVLQVVTAESTTNNTLNTTTLADCGLSASITPSSASNKILVLATQFIYHQEDSNISSAKLALLRDSTIISGDTLHQAYINGGTGSIVQFMFQYPFMVLDSPSTTSAITYKTQGRLDSTANNAFIQTGYSSAKSHMTLIEIDGT
jgi:hypothetical protein